MTTASKICGSCALIATRKPRRTAAATHVRDVHAGVLVLVPRGGLEPPRVSPRVFETRASTIPPPRLRREFYLLLPRGGPAAEVLHEAALKTGGFAGAAAEAG
jgi:hypothetical protein